MKNENAIKLIEQLKNGTVSENNEQINVALDMAIKAIEQEPCEDCVSREELKKWLDMNFSFGGALRKLELFDRLDKELPSVKPASNLDKIRAEIEQKARPNEIGGRGNGKSIRYGLCMALQIIDKYKEK